MEIAVIRKGAQIGGHRDAVCLVRAYRIFFGKSPILIRTDRVLSAGRIRPGDRIARVCVDRGGLKAEWPGHDVDVNRLRSPNGRAQCQECQSRQTDYTKPHQTLLLLGDDLHRSHEAGVLMFQNVAVKNKSADLLFGIEVYNQEHAPLSIDRHRVVPDVEVISTFDIHEFCSWSGDNSLRIDAIAAEIVSRRHPKLRLMDMKVMQLVGRI